MSNFFFTGRAYALLLGAACSVFVHPHAPQPLNDVLRGPLRERFAPFLDVVLQQVSSEDFCTLIDEINRMYHPKTDAEWYAHILQHIASIQSPLGKYTPLHKLAALKHQRAVLSAQLQQLITPLEALSVRTCVEIGSPATYTNAIRAYVPHLEHVIALSYVQKATDIVEGFSDKAPLNPYDQFVPLDHYDPIRDIPHSSVDLVICTIGLHHVPEEKLNPFIASIRAILKPGGIFILRDHDAADQETVKLAHAAHSIFNAVLAQEPLENELDEYRNFQPLPYWIELLQSNGFDVSTEHLLQEGDPTLNTLIKAIARPHTAQEYETMTTERLARQPGHYRDLMQTYLTTPEWVSVDIPQEYGAFINHTPFYEFPWLQNVSSFWKAFYGAWNVAVQKRGILPVMLSPYTLMNLFIGSTLTIEHIAKAIISAPIRYLYSGAETETLQALVYDPANEIMHLHKDIKILEHLKFDLKVIDIPRYKQFLSAILNVSKTKSLEFRTIGGQKSILCKIRSKDNSHRSISSLITGCTVEFEWTLPTQPLYTYAGITVPVTALKQVIQLMTLQGNEVLYVHDF